MTPAELAKQALGAVRWQFVRADADGRLRIEICPGDLSFDVLERLSQTLGTRNINIRFDGGWPGTEVTPGDAASVTIIVADIP